MLVDRINNKQMSMCIWIKLINCFCSSIFHRWSVDFILKLRFFISLLVSVFWTFIMYLTQTHQQIKHALSLNPVSVLNTWTAVWVDCVDCHSASLHLFISRSVPLPTSNFLCPPLLPSHHLCSVICPSAHA